jgi:hypothetical protein
MTILQMGSILAVFLGEALCIYAEMLVARGAGWLLTFSLITLAGIPLLAGYRFGYQSFGSMWVMMVVSVVSILIVEPLLVTSMFKETPSWGSMAGFACGVIGLYLTLRY